jgi:glycosyltransferase involved in cell wall biosynthesis
VLPAARLLIANEGSQVRALRSLTTDLQVADGVQFLGRLTPVEIRDALSTAHVYVSVPSTDSLAASTLEAMARGAFPVVSDLPSQDGFIEHGVTGLRVTPRDAETLALALQRALVDPALRRRAADLNRAKVEHEARLEREVDRLEAAFYGLSPS